MGAISNPFLLQSPLLRKRSFLGNFRILFLQSYKFFFSFKKDLHKLKEIIAGSLICKVYGRKGPVKNF